jgi:hypothetical protein
MPDMQIPDFLRRTTKGPDMTSTSTAEPKTRTKRQSAYIANIKAVAPLKDAACLVKAMQALEAVQTGLEAAGYTVTIAADTGKI